MQGSLMTTLYSFYENNNIINLLTDEVDMVAECPDYAKTMKQTNLALWT